MRSLGLILILGSLLPSSAAPPPRQGNTALLINVRPEAALTAPAPDLALVKIRLPKGVPAAVWTADSCGSQPAEGSSIIRASGVHQVPLQSPGRFVCLAAPSGNLQAPRNP